MVKIDAGGVVMTSFTGSIMIVNGEFRFTMIACCLNFSASKVPRPG
jgi:hypothetical protein